MCAQWRLVAQSDLSLFVVCLKKLCILAYRKKHTMKILIGLHECSGRSEFLLVTCVQMYIFRHYCSNLGVWIFRVNTMCIITVNSVDCKQNPSLVWFTSFCPLIREKMIYHVWFYVSQISINGSAGDYGNKFLFMVVPILMVRLCRKWSVGVLKIRSCHPVCLSYLSSGPSCSKLTMWLVKDSLKFTSSDTQICWNFLLKKCE